MDIFIMIYDNKYTTYFLVLYFYRKNIGDPKMSKNRQKFLPIFEKIYRHNLKNKKQNCDLYALNSFFLPVLQGFFRISQNWTF